jgi:hypothetical protein
MNNKTLIERKLSFLYDELETLDESSFLQQKFLLEQIDFYNSELLREMTLKRFKEIENAEVNKN